MIYVIKKIIKNSIKLRVCAVILAVSHLRKNRCAQSGSALLLVILITSALSILAFTSWYKSSLLFDLVVQREQYYKNFYLTETVLNHGVDIVKKQFDCYTKQQLMNLTSFVQNELNESEKGAQVVVTPNETDKNKLLVSAIIYNDKKRKKLCSLSCMLVKNENKFFIQNFGIGNTV